MTDSVESTQYDYNCLGLCIGFCSKPDYDQGEIEYIMDDYGGKIILINSENGKHQSVLFSKCNKHTLSIGFYSVTMVSVDGFISLVLVFNKRRELINGNLIKNGSVFSITEYNVLQSPDEDIYARCVYKK